MTQVRVAHFDCFSGISGDMTLAALIDIGVDREAICSGIASLGLPIQISIEKVRKGGFASTFVQIEAPEESTHRYLPEIEEILARGSLTVAQRDLAIRIFQRLAKAEAAAHGMAIEKVHFHEVGALDSIADIAGAAIGLDLLGVEHFSSRPVPTGHGMVKCAHGLMPIPTPATADLLKGVPLSPSTIKAELTTPTGAAILTTVVNEWTDELGMTIERIGHGAGRREFDDQPNLLRLFVGTRPDAKQQDSVWVLETNLDDVPAETVGYVYERLLAAGALDVFTIPIYMKKNRPAMLLTVLCSEAGVPQMEEILFRETMTLGIRKHRATRSILPRRAETVATAWGPVRGKVAWFRQDRAVFSPEFEDCARIAREKNLPLREVQDAAQKAYAKHAQSEPPT
ncbi:MAG TPA: nickel pincer cofactor biosynthesis protein LarC [Gemmataceae bacterium]|nr:nickel pincer cofactor biosynthesis protein LarC [Gemmataceae bacterium]